ncbi:hypothetical protein, partial [Marinimicrococcus flavescens]|nr:hypothetical protein [Marinimicrococcus flavescens]
DNFAGGQPAGLAWLSPDCKHICRIKGVRPAGVREVDWVALKAEADRIKKQLGELTYGRSRKI